MAAQSARHGNLFFRFRILPPAAGEQRDGAGQHQKSLRDRAVRDAEPVELPADAQAAENSLEDDQQKRGDAEPVNPFARIFQPEPDGENRRQETDDGREQPVRVFVKNAADPLVERETANML